VLCLWRAKDVSLIRRRLDVGSVHANHRLEPVRVFAAEVVQKAMWRLHALNVDGRVFVPARPAWIDQELDVDALLIHVADASVDVSVLTPARTF
jgi:hypothetical protein